MSVQYANTLFIEDFATSRKTVLNSFRRRNLQDNVTIPGTAQECMAFFREPDFTSALIDFRLTDWVGSDNTNPITIDGVECYNGAQVARCLLRKKPHMKIGVFSTFETDLTNHLRQLDIYDQVQVVNLKDAPFDDVNKPLRQFVQKHVETEITLKPLHTQTGSLPKEIEVFRSRRILEAREEGEQLWKAGEYAWVAGVNTPVTDANEQFAINIDVRGQVNTLIDESTNEMMSYKDAREILIDNPALRTARSRSLFDLFAARLFSDSFMNKPFGRNELGELSRALSPLARLESQKILYKEIRSKMQLRLVSKEQLWDYLGQFNEFGFPRILDIFKGRVDKVHADAAIIKLVSFSPEGSVRREEFSPAFLKSSYLEESSQFEYTIYEPPVGGTAYFIEPI